MNNTNKNRFCTLKHHTGIRKDLLANKYVATKSIGGKRYSKSFLRLVDAVRWRNSFVPSNTNLGEHSNAQSLVGVDKIVTAPVNHLQAVSPVVLFADVWKEYQQKVFPLLEEITTQVKLIRAHEFFKPLVNLNMDEIAPELLDRHILYMKEVALIEQNKKRKNFDRPLDELRALFNWYRENKDYKFINPVLKRHYAMGIVHAIAEKNKKLSQQELLLFFASLTPLYADLAKFQFYIGGRIQEAAGIQKSSVDFINRSITIKDVVVWDTTNKKFLKLKAFPKNGQQRFCYLTDELQEIVRRRIEGSPENCSYVFHESGAPLSYRRIQYEYNKALRKCGLANKFSSTHILRHSMGTIARDVMGSLDYSQATLGHKSLKTCEVYSRLPDKAQIEAVIKISELLKGQSWTNP